jgi:manganese-dependent ADP-ribose/CDP-alcohol diphosphatase
LYRLQFGRVHYVTLEAMLEAPEGSTSYATLEVYEHDVHVVGVGCATSRRLQVSPDGVFTGVAMFGRMTDVMESGMAGAGEGGDGVVVERSEMGLLDWINANRGSMGGGGGDITLR